MLNNLIKWLVHVAGLKVEWRDRLVESIPSNYVKSPFLPPIYLTSVRRILYFREMLERVRHVPGDLVECGTSLGYGLLDFLLLSELAGIDRTFYGFDSFAGFPAPVLQDRGTHVKKGDYASPPEIVLRVLREGQVSEQTIRERLNLVRGYFDHTLPSYQGHIALLHLDCDLYESYLVCLQNLYDKVVPGGIILFDEYPDVQFPGARKAIDEFFADKPEKPVGYENWKFYVVKGQEPHPPASDALQQRNVQTRPAAALVGAS